MPAQLRVSPYRHALGGGAVIPEACPAVVAFPGGASVPRGAPQNRTGAEPDGGSSWLLGLHGRDLAKLQPGCREGRSGARVGLIGPTCPALWPRGRLGHPRPPQVGGGQVGGSRAQPDCPGPTWGTSPSMQLQAAPCGVHCPRGHTLPETGLQGPWWYMGMSTAGDASPLPQSRQQSGGSPLGWRPLPTLILNLGP